MQKIGLALFCALFMLAGMANAANVSHTTSITTSSSLSGDSAAIKDLPFTFTISAGAGKTISLPTSTAQVPLSEYVALPAGLTLNSVNATAGTAIISGTATVTGAFTLHLAVNGASDQDLFLVVANPNSDSNGPKMGSFVVLPSPTAVASTVQCTATGTDADGDNLAYFWDFGDGANSRLQNPTHEWATAGTYTVGLTISDGRKQVGKSQNLVVAATSSGGTLQITKAKIQFLFPTAKASGSRAQLTGVCVGTNPPAATGQWVLGDLPNTGSNPIFAAAVTRSVTNIALSSGSYVGGDASNRIALKVLVTGSSTSKYKLTIDMVGSTLFTELTSLGFLNKFVGPRPAETHAVPLYLKLGSDTAQTTSFTVSYKCTKNRQGIAELR